MTPWTGRSSGLSKWNPALSLAPSPLGEKIRGYTLKFKSPKFMERAKGAIGKAMTTGTQVVRKNPAIKESLALFMEVLLVCITPLLTLVNEAAARASAH